MRTPSRPLRSALLTVVVLVATLVVASGTAVAADVRHSGRYWVWFGPKPWHASYGTYGIRVESPAGQDVLDLGFSSTQCTAGATYAKSVTNHFAALRRQYSSRPFTLVSASAIYHPAGSSSTYRREMFRVRFTSARVAYTGLFTFDYDYQTTVATGFSTVNYCYQRSAGMYAPTSRFDKSSRAVLQRVYSSLAYSGPGACLGTKGNGRCDPDL